MARQQTVRRLWEVLQKSVVAEVKAKRTRGYEYLDSRDVSCGSEHAFRFPLGTWYKDALALEGALAAAVGAPVELINRGGGMVIRVVRKDFPEIIHPNMEHLRNNRILNGYNRLFEPVYHPMLVSKIVGGAPRSGKTDYIRWAILQLVRNGWDVRVIDMKGYSFLPFFGIPNLQIATDLDAAAMILEEAENTLAERERIILSRRDRSLAQQMKPVAVIIDEAAQIAPSMYSRGTDDYKTAAYCDRVVARLGQKGREPRVLVLYCTQRPDYKVINGQLRACVDAVLAFRTQTDIDSRIILGRDGAERISPLTPGRGIYIHGQEHLIQVPYVGDDDAWEKLLFPMKTEVMDGGRSPYRTEPPRTYIDGTFESAGCDNGAIGDAQRLPVAVEAGKRVSSQSRKGSPCDVPLLRGEKARKNMAPYRKGPPTDWDQSDEID